MSDVSPDHDPVHAAPFVPEQLHELLGDAEAARARRQRAQAWLIGIGLAILALGLPSERLWGDMALVRMTAGNGETSTGILFPLAALLTRLAGTGAEQTCFLLSALAYGLLVPALRRLLVVIGFDHSIAMAATVLAAMTPALLIGASLPLDHAAGALGATLLLTTLFQPRTRVTMGYQWRALTLFFLAFLLRPENVLLLPAVVWAVVRQAGRARGPLAGITVSVAALFAVSILVTGRADAFWDTVLAGREPSWSGLGPWLVFVSLGLGASLFGLYALLLDRRLPEETPAPKWMVPWCLVALAPVAGGSASAGPVAAFLVPAAAVGLADWLTRRGREDLLRRALLVAVCSQLALALGARLAWEISDPMREERATLRRGLEPTDVVLVSDPIKAYLIELRWGLQVAASLEELTEGATTALDRGEARLVVLAGELDLSDSRWPCHRLENEVVVPAATRD